MASFILNGKYNLTFVHIPKTAGTSISKWVKEKDSSLTFLYDHPFYEDIREHEQIKNFSFTVVRNPWDRFVSLYFWLSGPESSKEEISPEKFKELTKLVRENFPTFESFVEEFPKMKQSKYNFESITPQNRWITPGVDLILRYENLEEDFKKIRDIFNDHTSPLPHRYKTKHDHYRSYYNDHTRKLIAKFFEEDIDLFKYQF